VRGKGVLRWQGDPDRETRAKLNGLTEPVELYDEDGNLLAYCTPVLSDPGLDSLPRYTGPNPFTEEEMNTRPDPNDPGRPLADILADLRRKYP
jgi:hypothetical protein